MSAVANSLKYTLKVHLYTFVVSALFCILLLVSDKDFGKENVDGGTIIAIAIYFLLSQIMALGGNALNVRSNYFVASICYGILGVLLGIIIAIVLAMVV